eukprot:3526146-Prymnesium_polylepis.1
MGAMSSAPGCACVLRADGTRHADGARVCARGLKEVKPLSGQCVTTVDPDATHIGLDTSGSYKSVTNPTFCDVTSRGTLPCSSATEASAESLA